MTISVFLPFLVLFTSTYVFLVSLHLCEILLIMYFSTEDFSFYFLTLFFFSIFTVCFLGFKGVFLGDTFPSDLGFDTYSDCFFANSSAIENFFSGDSLPVEL